MKLKWGYLDPLGNPCPSKASRENLDLDLHLSASGKGRFVIHIFQDRHSEGIPSWVHPKSSKSRFLELRRCRQKSQGPFLMLKLKYLEDPLGTPCSSKAFRENVDLDLHLSASDRGRFVLHIFQDRHSERIPSWVHPKSSKSRFLKLRRCRQKVRAIF